MTNGFTISVGLVLAMFGLRLLAKWQHKRYLNRPRKPGWRRGDY